MPHRCMNCGAEYADDAEELVEGCDCGSNLFLYKKDVDGRDMDELEEEKQSVMEELDKFIRDVKNKIGGSESNVQFDLESIRVMEDGVYEIDVRKLLQEAPLIVEIKDGAYKVHLASVFSKGEDRDLRKHDLDADEEKEVVDADEL